MENNGSRIAVLEDSPTARTIDRAAIQLRLDSLRAERQRRLDDVNAFNGAIQDCEHWLGTLEEDAE